MKSAARLLAFSSLFFTLPLERAPMAGRWELVHTVNSIPNRGECGMAAAKGKLYLLGGGALPTQVFDPVTRQWTEKAKAPVDMNHLEAVALNNSIYVLEAFSGGTYPDQPNLPAVWRYDIASDSWKSGGALPVERQRAAAGAAAYGNKLYLVNGIKHGHDTGTCALFDEYDPLRQQWRALPDAPHVRDHSAAAVIGDKLYVAGGRNTSYHEPGNFMSFFDKVVLDVDCYDFKSGHWSTLDAKLPMGSGGGALVNLDGTLYYIGGERATATEANRPRADVFKLSPGHDRQWIKMPDLNEPRNGTAAAVLNHSIYVFGGAGPKTPPMPDGPRKDSARRSPVSPPSHDGPPPSSPLEMFTAP